MRQTLANIFLLPHFGLAFLFLAAPSAPALAEPPVPPAWALRADVEVDGQGIFLPQVVEAVPAAALPNLRLGDAPALGAVVTVTLAQLLQAVHAIAPEWVPARWSGAEQARVHRRARTLTEAAIKELLTDALQREHVGPRGELELRLTRPWTPLLVQDDPLQVRLTEFPATGITAYFIVRFELLSGESVLGQWQVAAQARVWKEIWVARGPLARGQDLLAANLVKERRDVLGLREPLLDQARLQAGWEISQSVPAGLPLLLRHVRTRPVVHRGQLVDAHLREGPVIISMRVEALESGAPGELIRVRNPKTRHEFKGKVADEQTIQVIL